MPTFLETQNPVQSVGIFLSAIAARDNRFIVDEPRAVAWLEDIGHLDIELCKRAVQAHYRNPEKCIYEIKAGHVIAYVNSCAQPVEMCSDHPWSQAKGCSACRSERLELGLEKPLGRSTVPQLTGGKPMPERVRAAIEAFKRP